MTNNGTAPVPALTVVDNLPSGLAFDDSFVGDGGLPFTATVTNLPPDYPAAPAPTFESVPDPGSPDRVGQVRWTFPDYDLPVGATVTIQFRVLLEPGVEAGDVITNTMGASSPAEGLECTAPDPVVDDGTFGDGPYCTDPANVTARAGASFTARKWVAGSPDLGWFSPRTGSYVPVGGGGCPSMTVDGVQYTANPCVALTYPGEEFRYILRVQNAGTEPATRMTLIDNFPAPGDTGVLGSPRLTEWDNRPTLEDPAVFNGPGNAQIGYTSGTPCTADLILNGPGCPADAWDDGPGPSTTAMRIAATFSTPLPPAGTVDISFSMRTPLDVTQTGDPTIAWNSFAHAEATRLGSGGERVLPPIEPIKVGVATFYGSLQVVKEIGENPAGLPVDALDYTFQYDCVLRDPNGDVTSASGEVTARPGTPGVVTGIPAGSTCAVWESGTNGGIPSATEAEPEVVEIRPDETAPVLSTVTVTNSFPMGELEVSKVIDGDVDEAFTAGPYTASVTCSFNGTTLTGFPVDVPLVPGETASIDAPVGASCTVTETVTGGAHTVTYDPPDGVVTIPADDTALAEVTVTNTFEVGSLVVEKSVIGAGVPQFSDGPFVFDVVCAFNGDPDAFTTTVTVDGSSDGTPVRSDPVEGLPIGAECTVTETDDGGADFTPLPVTVTIGVNPPDNVTLADFNNPFSAGTISVTKTVDGTAASSEYVAGLTFTVAVECAVQSETGELVSLYSGELAVTPGTPTTALDERGNPVLLPVDARCWATEPATGGATAVRIDHTSFETGVAVLPLDQLPGPGPQHLTIAVTNTYDAATLTVSKAAVNEPAGAGPYTFDVTCTIVDTDGATIPAPLLAGTSPLTLAAGEQAELSVLEGSTCTVTETGVPAGATVTIAETTATPDADPADGTVTVAGAATAAFTNTFDPPATTTTTPSGAGGGSGTGSGGGSAGSGGGRLPGTGAQIATTLAVAAALGPSAPSWPAAAGRRRDGAVRSEQAQRRGGAHGR